MAVLVQLFQDPIHKKSSCLSHCNKFSIFKTQNQTSHKYATIMTRLLLLKKPGASLTRSKQPLKIAGNSMRKRADAITQNLSLVLILLIGFSACKSGNERVTYGS